MRPSACSRSRGHARSSPRNTCHSRPPRGRSRGRGRTGGASRAQRCGRPHRDPARQTREPCQGINDALVHRCFLPHEVAFSSLGAQTHAALLPASARGTPDSGLSLRVLVTQPEDERRVVGDDGVNTEIEDSGRSRASSTVHTISSTSRCAVISRSFRVTSRCSTVIACRPCRPMARRAIAGSSARTTGRRTSANHRDRAWALRIAAGARESDGARRLGDRQQEPAQHSRVRGRDDGAGVRRAPTSARRARAPPRGTDLTSREHREVGRARAARRGCARASRARGRRDGDSRHRDRARRSRGPARPRSGRARSRRRRAACAARNASAGVRGRDERRRPCDRPRRSGLRPRGSAPAGDGTATARGRGELQGHDAVHGTPRGRIWAPSRTTDRPLSAGSSGTSRRCGCRRPSARLDLPAAALALGTCRCAACASGCRRDRSRHARADGEHGGERLLIGYFARRSPGLIPASKHASARQMLPRPATIVDRGARHRTGASDRLRGAGAGSPVRRTSRRGCRPEPCDAVVAAGPQAGHEFEHGSVELDHLVALGAEDEPGAPWRAAPRLADRLGVPPPRHPQVRVHGEVAREAQEEVLAVGVDRLDLPAARRRSHARSEPWRASSCGTSPTRIGRIRWAAYAMVSPSACPEGG